MSPIFSVVVILFISKVIISKFIVSIVEVSICTPLGQVLASLENIRLG